ncbi:MAG: hypothetical protein EA362_06125 [Saprospirales bacterium]|nr:MAG: hypothetical protein EA362_06125 [Saprospirales bacterium]
MFFSFSKNAITTQLNSCHYGILQLFKWLTSIWILVFFVFTASAQNCPVPIPLNITNITIEAATVSWFQSGSPPDSFDISYRTVPGSYPGEPQFSGINSSPFEITDLQSGVLYEFRIRSRCGMEISDWSQPRRFITHLTNPSDCQLQLPLGDNNCGSVSDVFRISVADAPGDNLGVDVFIEKILLIIDHTWPADLNIRLRSPDGTEITLSSDNGIGDNHYGNPTDTTCSSTTTFSDEACTLISDAAPPFIGTFRPEQPIATLHDSSSAIGIWELHICDKAPGDIGTLLFFEVEFTNIKCIAPILLGTDIIGDNQLQILLNPGFACDSILVEIGPQGFTPQGFPQSADSSVAIYYFSCDMDTLIISDLEPNLDYDFYLYSICDSITSSPSCVKGFSTNCPPPKLNSNFDVEEICELSCLDACNLAGWWRNKSNTGPQWQINSGSTPTEGTGPETAEKGFGNYLLFNGSSPLCYYPESAVLESTCIEIISAEDDCDFSFFYHMWGPEVKSLHLLLSTDGGFNWDSLWKATGNQGNQWIQTDIDLSSYHGTVGRFRFVAEGSESGRGDIALDNILLYHSTIVDSSSLIYFVDDDGDGYGQNGTETFFCTLDPPDGWADQGGDCDDENPAINPGAELIPCNLIDENCTGLDDDQPADNPISHELISISHESCSRANDGRIEISISGGIPPYSILWNTGDTSSTIESLTSGIYFATIADTDSCLYRTEFFEIQTTTAADLSFVNIERPSCSSINDGQIEVLIGGGTAPFNYEWNTGDTTSLLSEVFSGNYRVSVIDADSCVYISEWFHLRPLTPFDIVVAEKASPSCHGIEDGSITVQIFGGSPPFLYEWSTGDSLSSIDQVGSGYYHLTVTDANDCQVVKDSIFLNEPEPLLAIFPTISTPLCPGQSTSRVLTEIQGGTFPYTFFWQKGNNTYTTKDLINVPAGTYQLTITDINGCSFNDEVIISEPDSFFVKVLEKNHVSCGNRTDGNLEVEINGGWPPYEIFWSTGEKNENQISELASGYYQFTISDQAGCKFTSEEIQIQNRNLPLEVQLTVLDSISCYQAGDGRIRAEVASPYSPYIFNWSHLNPVISDTAVQILDNAAPNNYLLTVSDASACSGISQPLLVTEPQDLIITDILVKKPSCHGDSDGELTPIFSGGTAPYSFLWSDGSDQEKASQLTAGSYHLTISDKNECRRSRNNITLNQPDPIEIDLEVLGSREGENEGEANLEIEGGIPPYDIVWDERITRFSNEKATELNPGEYDLTIIDANGCQIDTSFLIELITGTLDFERSSWVLFPNPTYSDLSLRSDSEIHLSYFNISLRDITGKQIDNIMVRSINFNTIRIQLPDHISSGSFFLEVKNKATGKTNIFPFSVQER